jgi:Lysozyme like domain
MTSSLAPGNIQYNYAQLEGIWNQAGGSPGAAPIAAAIAMAESGGNTTATDNDSNGTVDRGLWQINSVHGAQSTYDVMGNARAAIAISNNGTNWAPWTTYTNGAYRQFLQTNVPPDTSAPINATNAAANQSTATLTGISLPGGLWDPLNWFLNPLGSAGQAAGGAASAVGPTLVKYFLQGLIITVLNPMIQLVAGVMGITSGAAMVVIGFWIVAHNTETGQQIEHGAGTAAQAGLAAFGPEATAATQYVSRSGGMTTVTQHRRPAGAVGVGGRRIQYRPARVRTEVQKPPPSTGQQLRNESAAYVNKPSGSGGNARERAAAQNRRHGGYKSESTGVGGTYTGPRRGGRN